MILSCIFKKIQKLDNQIQVLSEMTPTIDKRTDVMFVNNQKNNKQNTEILKEKVNELEKLVSNLI